MKSYKDTIKQLNHDSIIKLVGQFGKWQLITLFAVQVINLIPTWMLISKVFLLTNKNLWCVNFAQNKSYLNTVSNSTCHEDCVNYNYDSEPTKVSEWGLVCEKQWLINFIQIVLEIGMILGSVVFGFYSDRYGRQKALTLTVILVIPFGLSVPLSPNYEIFTTIRFFIGFFIGGINSITFTLLMESIGPKYRECVGCVFQCSTSLCNATICLLAYCLTTWKKLTLGLGVLALLSVFMFKMLNESPRWLICTGKVERAVVIIKQVAKTNYIPTVKLEDTVTRLSDEIKCISETSKFNFLDLFREIAVRKVTVYSAVLWMGAGITRCAIYQYTAEITTNIYVMVAGTGLIQLPSYVVTIFLIKYFGRKKTVAFSFLFICITVLLLEYLPKIFCLTLTLATLGISCSAINIATLYIYSLELYPTVIRNMGLSLLSAAMYFGHIVTWIVPKLSIMTLSLPSTIHAGISLLAMSICFLLPETRGKKLPDVLQELTQ